MKENIPTKAELEILQILWRLGPTTVRKVHEAMGRATGYTTVLKMLQIMTEKGLVDRETEAKAHVYRARANEKRATGEFIHELVERVFGGSSLRLVMQALNSQKSSPGELKKIRKLLDELENK